MVNQSGAKLLVEALKANGTEYLIGIHGVQSLGVLDILYDEPSIKVITVRHEEASPFTCYGYAKATGRPAVCFSTPGPGATNMVTSVAAGYAELIPMVVVSAQIPLALMDRATNHKCDLEGVFRPITKEVITCHDVNDIPAGINRAFQLATEGRNGPVMVLIPSNLFGAMGEAEISPPAKKVWQPDASLESKLEQAVSILERSKAPTIFAGGGLATANAAAELQQLALKLSAPVFTSEKGRGVIPEDHPLCAGIFLLEGSTEILSQSDVCIALGTKFPEFSTLGWTVRFPDNLIEVNIDAGTIGKTYKPKVALIADVKYVLQKLLGMVSQKQADGPIFKTLKRFKRKREQATVDLMSQAPVYPLHPLWMVRRLREFLPPDTVVVVDNTSSALGAFREHEFTVYQPRTLLSNDAFGSMGFSLPASIGVKLGDPGLKVVCVVGDGSFLMQMSELATAAAYGISLPIIVMNNGYYGVLQQHQQRFCRQRFIGAELNNPDFVQAARGFGVAGYRVGSPAELQPAVEEALSRHGPTIIDVPIDIKPVGRDLRFRWLTMGLISDINQV